MIEDGGGLFIAVGEPSRALGGGSLSKDRAVPFFLSQEEIRGVGKLEG